MKTTKTLLSTYLVALLGFSVGSVALAQSENQADNKDYMEKTIKELAEYLGNKCGDFKVEIKFDEKFEYTKNPTLGTPTPKDRATAGLYAVASVCESGDPASNRIKSKFNSISIKQGSGNIAKLNGKTLELSYNPASNVPFGRLRDEYFAQINRM